MSEKYVLKILTLGDTSVGKTSIVIRYSDNTFNETNTLSTIGVDFKIKRVKKGGESIKVSIYDTAGQERFQNIIKHYYRGANGILLTFDISNRNTCKKLDFWYNDMKENIGDLNKVFICLIGNKIDKEEKREITFEEANQYANEKKLPYFEVSAKTGKGIKQLFDEAIKGSMTKLLMNCEKEKGDYVRLSFLDKDNKRATNRRCC